MALTIDSPYENFIPLVKKLVYAGMRAHIDGGEELSPELRDRFTDSASALVHMVERGMNANKPRAIENERFGQLSLPSPDDTV